MLAAARELLGDLIVATVELGDTPDAARRERWVRLAAAAAAAHRSAPAPDELLITLADALGPRLVIELREAAEALCERGRDWELVCAYRSGLEAIRDLFALRYFDDLDLSRIERRMLQRGPELYRPLAVPDGMPAYHWWWFAGAPPNERTLQINTRMRALLPEPGRGLGPPASDIVAPQFRALVARGFRSAGDCLFFRDRVAAPPPDALARTRLETERNLVQLADVLEPDPSRRPVDTAAAALACARHLAFELARAGAPSCRIVVTVFPGLNTIRFHRVRPADGWVDSYAGAVLALDTEP